MDITSEIAQSIPLTNVDPASYMTEVTQNQSMFVHESTPAEVSNVIRSLKLKGCHLDEIPTFLVKDVN